MRVDERPALVHGADAVGVAVCDHAEVAHPRADGGGQGVEILGDRLGVDTAEAGVHLAADLGDLTARPLQKRLDHAASRAVHGIHDEALGIVRDDVGVDQFAQVVEIGRQGIEFLDKVRLAGDLKIHGIGTACLQLVVVDIDFHAAALFGQGRAAERALELDAVVARRVVRGGDHHAGDGALVLDRVGNGRRGCIRVGEQDCEAVPGQHAGHFTGIAVGEEARIEPDHDLLRVGFGSAVAGFIPVVGGDRVGDGLGDHAQVAECKRV